MSMPALLVSVRSLADAQAAVAGGCDRLDVKEPLRGPLGMADPKIIAQVARFSSSPDGREASIPCSVALGELHEWINDDNRAQLRLPQFPQGITDIKFGPACIESNERWFPSWRRFSQLIPLEDRSTIRRVAVAYADWKSAQALPAAQILENAIEVGAPAFLVDTYQKTGRCLFDALSFAELERLTRMARQAGMTVALAGSVTLEHAHLLIDLQPDVIAVRGAVCANRSRTADVSSILVQRLKAAIAEASKKLSTIRSA